MDIRRVLVTGISGTTASERLKVLEKRFEQDGCCPVEVHNVGAMMNQIVQERGISLKSSNILNAPKDTLTALRTAALERIQRIASERIQVIDVHATFLTKSGLKEGLSFNDVKNLHPDMFVTIIDSPDSIHTQLKEHPGKYLHLSVADIVKWQEFEVYVTNLLSKILGVRHFVVPQRQVSLVKSLIFDLGKKPPIYASYPMTHLPAEEQPKIQQFIRRLERWFTVFDPSSIDSSLVVKPYFTDADIKAISDHTIVRDLDWFIGINSDKVVAYLPRIVFSSGMNDELRYGYEAGKETFVILEPDGEHELPSLSPFTEYKSRIFWSLDDFEMYLELGPAKQEVYDQCEEQMLELLRAKRYSTPKDEFLKECVAACQYNLPERRYEQSEDEVERIASNIWEKWSLAMKH